MNGNELARVCEMSRTTIYKYLKLLNNNKSLHKKAFIIVQYYILSAIIIQYNWVLLYAVWQSFLYSARAVVNVFSEYPSGKLDTKETNALTSE